MPSDPAPRSRPAKSWARRIVDRYGGRIRDSCNRFVAPYSKIGDRAVFDPAEFDWAQGLEHDWKVVCEEADEILAAVEEVPPLGNISPDHRRLDQRRTWRTFLLWGYGLRIDRNCARCPRTTRLVERVPGLLTAMFSIHEPGTHLPRHRGVTKGFITCHLGLRIPRDRDRCRIQVEECVYGWRERRWFIFDDSRHHEVWNEAEETRVILLLHVRRSLRTPGRWVSSY